MFLEQTLSLLVGVLQGVLAGVNVLIVVLGVITLDAGGLGYLDVVDEAAFLGLAIAEVQVRDAGLFASVNRVSQGYLEGASGGLLVEAQVTDVSAVGGTWSDEAVNALRALSGLYVHTELGSWELAVVALGANVLSAQSNGACEACLLYTSPSPRDGLLSRMPSSA